MLFVPFNFHIYILQGFTQSLNSTICHQVCYLQSCENCLQHMLYPLALKQFDMKLVHFHYWTSRESGGSLGHCKNVNVPRLYCPRCDLSVCVSVGRDMCS
jgi:hypothetical protein